MNEELIDGLTREIYQNKANPSIPYTDEKWESIKSKSFTQGSIRMCRAEAVQMIEDGDF